MLMAILGYVVAIFIREIVGKNCEQFPDYPPKGTVGSCDDLWGDIIRTMYTLFQIVTLESWSVAIVRPIIREKPLVAFCFIVFIMLTSFGLMNIVVGIICECTSNCAWNN